VPEHQRIKLSQKVEFLMKNKDYYLLLPVEVARRELLAKLYVGLKGVKRGYRVVIGDHARPVFKRYSTGFLLYKDHAPWSKERLFRFKRKGLHIGCLDEEGLIYKSEHIYKTTRCSSEVLSLLDAVFLWGNNQREVMKGLSKDNKLFCVGNPRLDILKGLKAKDSRTSDYNKILINTRFPSCNGFRGDAEINNLRKLQLVTNDPEHKEYLEFVRVDKIIFDGFLELIQRLSKNGKYSITIRPHPSESTDIYYNIAADKDNVIVDNDAELVDQINDNDIIIHDGCTTAIEASAAGKIVLGFRPPGANLNYGQFANRFSKNFNDIMKLSRYIENISSEKHHHEIDDEEAQYFISNWHLRGSNASDCILDVVDQFRVLSTQNVNNPEPILFGFGGDGLKYWCHLLLMQTRFRPILTKFFGERFNEYYKNVQMNEHKFPPLTEGKVRDAIDFLCSLDDSLGAAQDYRVEMIGKKAFLLSGGNA
jgi:surface carbohydrate biosynthesis protein